MRDNSKKIFAVVTAAVLLCSMFLLTGCGSFFNSQVKSIKFTQESITLEISQTKDINSTVVEVLPRNAKNRKFTLTSEDSSKVAILDSVASPYKLISAVGLGTTKITATSSEGGFTATIPVTVTHAKISEFDITYDKTNLVKAGNTIIMDSNEPSVIDFGVSLSQNCDPDTIVKWSCTFNDNEVLLLQSTLKASQKYNFSSTAVGKYSIFATVTDNNTQFKAFANINICAPIENAQFSYEGVLLQDENNYSTVNFDIGFTNPEGNPDAIVEWFVNDEKQKGATPLAFAFKPQLPGKYVVSAKLNGKNVMLVGGELLAVTITAKGKIVPKNVVLDVDNCYPKIIVSWTEIPLDIGYSIEIINKTTGKTVASNLNTNNSAIKNKFTRNSFDASEYLSKAGATIFDTSFIVKVKTLGNDVFTESDYSKPFESERINIKAKPFLESGFYDKNRNYYITSEDEFVEWIAYAMLWRDSGRQKLYFAFEYDDMQALLTRVSQKVHFTGNSSISTNTVGNEVTANITFTTDGTPSLSMNNSGDKVNNWGGARPHINYVDTNGRADSFKIDKKPAVAVETSEQLYYVAELGYKPVPVSGSVAEKIYKNARSILRNIITDDFTDMQKVHAIYDYIMWRVTYDFALVNKIDKLPESSRVPTAVKYNPYYLESVLGDSDYFAVCDGMAKAFSLLSNIEGLPALRVAGNAGSVGKPKSGHAWNKVFVDGGWYIVDCTWGDSLSENGIEGGQKESANHMYFMLIDSEVAATHVEEEGISYPKTPLISYNFHDKDIISNGKSLDFYLSAISTIDAESVALSNYMYDSVLSLRANGGKDTNYAVGPNKQSVSSKTSTSFFTIDVKVSSALERYFNGTMADPITKALSAKGLKANLDFSVFISKTNGSMFLIITLRVAAVKA